MRVRVLLVLVGIIFRSDHPTKLISGEFLIRSRKHVKRAARFVVLIIMWCEKHAAAGVRVHAGHGGGFMFQRKRPIKRNVIVALL